MCRRCGSSRAVARRCRSSRRPSSSAAPIRRSCSSTDRTKPVACAARPSTTRSSKRLGTAGRIFPEMNVRLFDDDDNDVTATGVGRCACKGPGITPGYYGNADANAKLFRPDGWMYLGDIVKVDEDDYLRVVGRTADFIIRAGHNISAPAVEEEILGHPARRHGGRRCHARSRRRRTRLCLHRDQGRQRPRRRRTRRVPVVEERVEDDVARTHRSSRRVAVGLRARKSARPNSAPTSNGACARRALARDNGRLIRCRRVRRR